MHQIVCERSSILTQDQDKLKQLESLLDGLAASSDQHSFPHSEQRYIAAPLIRLFLCISRQQTFLAKGNNLDMHFLLVSSYKAKAIKLTDPSPTSGNKVMS